MALQVKIDKAWILTDTSHGFGFGDVGFGDLGFSGREVRVQSLGDLGFSD